MQHIFKGEDITLVASIGRFDSYSHQGPSKPEPS